MSSSSPRSSCADGDAAPSLPTDLLKLDLQLCFALYAASLAMTKVYKPLLAPLGLTYPQYLVMLLLWEHDDRTVNELGQLLQLDSGTLTPLLKRMASQGLLSRERDPEDERRVRLRLTAAGRELKQKATEIPSTLACKVDLDHQELADLRTQLHQLRHRLTTEDASPRGD
ncbi:MAG TPA: MarR family transcriptional regulator [Aquabacterium sp.]|uniref:MarR family winged helix-turn-helix transcriptional regulator n=1 Tax=Aquabacterium sp. TaxID=1872578 RepID=UPI002E310A45|nr:MarR family transcriptional regulator [Aquabacterium sp.]HEX5354774.1 MarR family transcriptional regulator [Aquabacterium sp.]